MIIGATPDSDWDILRLTEGLYKKYGLRRVFYSAYMPVSENTLLPQRGQSLLFYVNTGSIKRTGCSAIMDLLPTNCSMNATPAFILLWTPNAAGQSIIWNNFPSKSTQPPMKCFCEYRGLVCAAPNASVLYAGVIPLTLTV